MAKSAAPPPPTSPPCGFSPATMHVLRSICDTFLPSLPYPRRSGSGGLEVVSVPQLTAATAAAAAAEGEEDEETLAAFYAISAADHGFPEQVASVMAAYLSPSEVGKVKKLLWLLSTRLGTAVLSKSSRFAAFPDLSRHHRQELLLSWSSGSSLSLRLAFQLFKVFVLREFYARGGTDGPNPVVWKAIDYPGADPRLRGDAAAERDEADYALERRIVQFGGGGDAISLAVELVNLGVEVTGVDSEHGRVKIRADAVVVGSGAGGSVVAARLAAAGHRVVILEKGPYLSRSDYTLLESDAAAMYENGSYLITDDGGALLFAGSTVGGGTTINWGASLRTPDSLRQEWARRHRLPLFESSAYDDAMAKVCERMGVQDAAPLPGDSLPNAVLRSGGAASGMRIGTVPRNSPPDHYCGWCGMGCRSGAKQSAGRTWLADAARGGAVILAGCEAERVLLSKNGESSSGKPQRAVGVTARRAATSGGGGPAMELTVEAAAVVVAAGALWTPVLLRRSGLRNEHIGRHLRIHPVLAAWGYFPEAPADLKSYDGAIMTAYGVAEAEEGGGGGALVMVPSLHPGGFAAFMPWRGGAEGKETMRRFSRTAYLVVVTKDEEGEGEVAEGEGGKLRVRYKVGKADREAAVSGMRAAMRALAAAGAAEIGVPLVDGTGATAASAAAAALEEWMDGLSERTMRADGRTPLGSAHQMGTCRMAAAAAEGAVDPRGEAWEAAALFVADASVFPTASGVNPMVTVMAIAYATSRSVLQYLARTNGSHHQYARL